MVSAATTRKNLPSAPAMVYISGEEMTREVMKQVLEKWIDPYLDTSNWQTFDLSCKNRDDTDDAVLKNAIAAGTEIGAIFKEPTITATADQGAVMGLKKPQCSPNGKMREAWQGYSIDRDTISIPGLEDKMGYKKPVLFCRHAVGGEYGGTGKIVGAGTLKTVFVPEGGGPEEVVDTRRLTDRSNAAVVYHNPYDNLEPLAHHFFQRALDAGVTPYVVTKKTVFKWQEQFWKTMEKIFNEEYRAQFLEKNLLPSGKLEHVISDDASMKLQKWRDGGFAMVAHNYDGDVLTDEMSQIYRSPAFVSSVLTGIKPDGQKIMEFEASHGTIADQYRHFLEGTPTSVNPLGMVYALRGAIDHSATLAVQNLKMNEQDAARIKKFTGLMYAAMCETMASGKGTKDLNDNGLSTEAFIDEVAARLQRKVSQTFGAIETAQQARKFG